ncbi:hypothetical protein N8368_02970 [Bacteroidia bacterium]|nr:hypothetical protein [Bacteroidia bacterium]MDC1395450.1 hypothetical protein [Bacteroidia bacterium]
MPATRILDATYDFFFEGKVVDIDIAAISRETEIPEDEIRKIFPTFHDITTALSKRSIVRLKAQGEELAKQKGLDVLRELLSNDIMFFYRIEVDRKMLTDETIGDHVNALKSFDNYFNIEMPKIYSVFLENNKELLPSSDIDVKFYAHFIAHSLKFFNFTTLGFYESTSEGRKNATEQIIGSLFGLDFLELPKF